MRSGSVRTVLAPVLLMTALGGCKDLISGGDDVQREQYRIAHDRWEDAALTSYGYVLELACACAPASELRAVRVTVQDGTVVDRRYESNDPSQRTPASESVFGPYDTVEELFRAVNDAIGRDGDVLSVAYHPTYGVPTLLQWDPDGATAGDHLVVRVTGFAPAAAD